MDKLDPKIVDEWIAIVTNRGALVVIGAIVIAGVAGFVYLFWKFIRDMMLDVVPEIKGWFSAMKTSTISSEKNLATLTETMKETKLFHQQVLEDRRQCQVNTQIALMNSEVHTLMAKGTVHEKEVELLNQQIKARALDALGPLNPPRLGTQS